MSYANLARYTDVKPASVADIIDGRDIDITLDELCDIIAEKLIEEYIYTGGRRAEKGSRWTKGGHDRVYAPCGFYYDLSDGKIGGIGVSYVAPWLERTMSIVTATVEEHIVEPVVDDATTDTDTTVVDDATTTADDTTTTAPATADDIVRIAEAAASTITVDDRKVRITAATHGVRYGRAATMAMMKDATDAYDLDIDDAVSIVAQSIADLADTEISHTADIVSVIIDVAGAEPIEYAATPRTVDTICDAIEDTIIDEAGVGCIRSITVIGVDIDELARTIIGDDIYDKLVGDVDYIAVHAADAVELVGEYDIDDAGAVLMEAAASHAIVE